MTAALCVGCGDAIPLTDEQRLVSGTRGWWHSECHEKASHDVNRMLALRAVAKMHGYVEKSA